MSDKVSFKIEEAEEETREKTAESAVVNAEPPSDDAEKAKPTKPEKNDSDTQTIAPNFEKKGYAKEIAVASLMALICIGGAVLAALVIAYRYVGIIIAALGALAAFALIKHIFLAEKVLKIIGGAEKVYINELMTKLGRHKKPDFVREIGSLIKEGHLTGYAVMNDIYLIKREKE